MSRMEEPRKRALEWAKDNNVVILEEIKNSTQRVKYYIKDGPYAGLIGESKVQYIANTDHPFSWRSLTSESRYKYIERLFNNEGYEIISVPIKLNKKGSIVVKRVSDGYLWKTNLTSFEKGKRPRGSYGGFSKGEAIVSIILEHNNIENIPEYPVKVEGRNVRYDFHLPRKNTYIEYHGIQHFESVEYMEDNMSFEERVELDNIKEKYAYKNGSYVMIPYIYSSLEDITEVLSTALNMSLKVPEVSELSKFRETKITEMRGIAEYYKNHTMDDTTFKFGISENTVKRCFRTIYNMSRTDYHRGGNDREIVEYAIRYNATKAQNKYNTTWEYINSVCVDLFGDSYKELRDKKRKEIAKHAIENDLKDTAEKYNVGVAYVRGCVKEVYGMTKTEYLKGMRV